ncbi:MAG: DUF3160 domain-containing protein [Bacteroidetes bacterium]|nr:DUF3160 domain-containing protein [Bacteroidota bacterium]
MRIKFSGTIARAALAGLLIPVVLAAKPVTHGSSGPAGIAHDQAGLTGETGVSISTTFGVYQPYLVPSYKLIVGQDEPAIAANFSNVATGGGRFAWSNYFTAAERGLLTTNGFVLRPEAIASFGQAYVPDLAAEPLGSFVTVDAVLHGLRVTAAEAVRDMERNYAGPTLSSNLDDLAQALSSQLGNERNHTIAVSLERVLGYVQTAQVLLNPSAQLDPAVRDNVNAEVKKIMQASGSLPSSVLPPQTVDYALFAPRGYYTLDKQLGNYYRAKVWLSHVGFSLRGGGGGYNPSDVRAVALLARAIDRLSNGDELKQTLRNINETSAFFSGRDAGIAPWELLTNATQGYYGRIVEGGTGFLADEAMLNGFAKYLGEQLGQLDNSDPSLPAFHLIEWNQTGGHSLLDRIVRDAGASRGSYGFALMAAAGSPAAVARMGARSGFTNSDFAISSSASGSVQDMEGAILFTMRPLYESAHEGGYPHFMQNEAWQGRELMSTLGAYADYQHMPATMSMQNTVRAARVGTAGRDIASDGYVEPNPEAWARVAALAGYFRRGMMEGRGGRLIGRGVEGKLRDIESSAAGLMSVAAFELSNRDLTADQLALIASMRERIPAYETFADKELQGSGYVVTAGASNENGMANGHPLAIYVVAPRNDGEDGLMLTRGAVYSYFEVRDDDDAWRETLTTSDAKVHPDSRLTSGIVSSDRSFTVDPDRLVGVTGTMPAAPAGGAAATGRTNDVPASVRSNTALRLESSVVSRTLDGELWFTLSAPSREGTGLIAEVASASGQIMSHVMIGPIQNGERLDVVRINSLPTGRYYLRLEDAGGTLLATARFQVVK